jgi:predicted nucleic acid-binding protein
VAPLDLLIGCHALALERVLVSSDKTFMHIEGLMLEDWTSVVS